MNKNLKVIAIELIWIFLCYILSKYSKYLIDYGCIIYHLFLFTFNEQQEKTIYYA